MQILLIVLVLATNFATGHSIDLKQEESLRVGKLKHSITVLILNGVSFVAIVSWAGFGVLTAWAIILSLGFLFPLAQIPYTGRYNISFASGWRRYCSLKNWTYGAAFLAWCFF